MLAQYPKLRVALYLCWLILCVAAAAAQAYHVDMLANALMAASATLGIPAGVSALSNVKGTGPASDPAANLPPMTPEPPAPVVTTVVVHSKDEADQVVSKLS